jgi:hypothetical protein
VNGPFAIFLYAIFTYATGKTAEGKGESNFGAAIKNVPSLRDRLTIGYEEVSDGPIYVVHNMKPTTIGAIEEDKSNYHQSTNHELANIFGKKGNINLMLPASAWVPQPFPDRDILKAIHDNAEASDWCLNDVTRPFVLYGDNFQAARGTPTRETSAAKAARIACAHCPDHVPISAPTALKNPGAADWRAFDSRKVVILVADAANAACAENAKPHIEAAGAESVEIVRTDVTET